MIHRGNSIYQCLANLTIVLELVGQLSNAKYNSTAGALSLLLMAKALLSMPTHKIQIVYKLVLLASIFSMFLSLSRSIMLSNVGKYNPLEPFSYSGYMLTTGVTVMRRLPSSSASSVVGDLPSLVVVEVQCEIKIDVQQFVEQVKQQVDNNSRGGIHLGIFFAMVIQFALMVCLLVLIQYA